MKTFPYYLYIYFISFCQCKIVNARSVYDNSHLVEREESVPILSSYSKKKLLKDEVGRERNEENGEDLIESSNSLYSAPRFRQYNTGDMYLRQAPRMLARSNVDNSYNVRKREYYPDMKTARDGTLEVVLDPKTRKSVALIENSAPQDSYDLQGWKNSKDDNYGYDNEQYAQNNQDQVVNLIYPVNRADRMLIRNNVDAGALDSTQTLNQNKNIRNSEDCDNQEQFVYKATINEPERVGLTSQKIKRHIKADNREAGESHNNKDEIGDTDSSEVKERKAEASVAREEQYDTDKDENIIKQRNKNNKRSIPNWTAEQITALKNSLTMFQENDAEFDNLKSILNDMGFVENNSAKREIHNGESESDLPEKEDENLNENEITMKKNDKKWETSVEETAQENLNKRDLNNNNKAEENIQKQLKKRSEKLMYKKNIGEQNGAEQHKEINKNDDPERKKRDSERNVNNPDIMKGLEKSGELSVSGNKSPLASDEKSESDTTRNERLSKIVEDKQPMTKRNINDIDEDYEQKIENEIQAKIDAIKEKVKREIMLQKQKKYNYSRKKRETTLLDSENKNINPDLVADEELEPHIRTRRKINDETQNITNLAETYNNLTLENLELNANNESNLKETDQKETDLNSHIRSRRDTNKENQQMPEEDKSNLFNEKLIKKEAETSNAEQVASDQNKENIKNNDISDQSDMKKRKIPKEDSGDTLNIPSVHQNKVTRQKRANNILPENKMIFRPYLSQQDEEEEGEGGEFDNAYDQAYIDKREVYDPDYQYFENKEMQSNQEYQSPEKNPNYRGALSQEQRYRRSQLNYEDPNFEQSISRNSRNKYFSKRFDRNKRDNENAQLHGGGMLSNRKAALNIRGVPDDRDKRGNSRNIEISEEDDSDNSENEFFGSLPQNYQEGELNRYKRVKRETKLTDVT